VSSKLTSRRTFLAASGGGVAALWLGANAGDLRAWFQHAQRSSHSDLADPLLVLRAEQAADVEAIAAQLVPSDDTPGAREAGVIDCIDYALAHWAKPRLPALVEGLDALNAASEARGPGAARFATLASGRQQELLRAWELAEPAAFEIARSLTLAGMFSVPAHRGNRAEIGWHLLGFQSVHAWQPPFGAYDAEETESET